MIQLRRTDASEAKRLSLLPYAPTWASCSRLVQTYNADPGRQGQRLIRHRHGWAWTCDRCKRELEGDQGARPAYCPSCRAPGRLLHGHETLVYFLAQCGGGGAGYDGGIEGALMVVELGWWVERVAPRRWVSEAAAWWLNGHSYREAATAIHRSHVAVCLAIGAYREAWESLAAVNQAQSDALIESWRLGGVNHSPS